MEENLLYNDTCTGIRTYSDTIRTSVFGCTTSSSESFSGSCHQTFQCCTGYNDCTTTISNVSINRYGGGLSATESCS